MSSYDGGVFYGVNGDRDAMPDVAVLAELIEDAIAELIASASASQPRGGGRGTGTSQS